MKALAAAASRPGEASGAGAADGDAYEGGADTDAMVARLVWRNGGRVQAASVAAASVVAAAAVVVVGAGQGRGGGLPVVVVWRRHHARRHCITAPRGLCPGAPIGCNWRRAACMPGLLVGWRGTRGVRMRTACSLRTGAARSTCGQPPR